MKDDIRATATYREAEALLADLQSPGENRITDAAEIRCAPGGSRAAFAASMMTELSGQSLKRIYEADLKTGECRRVSSGSTDCWSPRYSPDGNYLAWLRLSDDKVEVQLHLHERETGAQHQVRFTEGRIEYFRWSPDGSRILLGVADHGADVSGGQGAITRKDTGNRAAEWMPKIAASSDRQRGRTVWIFDVRENLTRPAIDCGLNIWEADWCGCGQIVAITSTGAGEGAWYRAQITLIDPDSASYRTLYAPRDQVGLCSGSTDGRHLAFVEAVASDRLLIAGELRLITLATGEVSEVETTGTDVSCVEWLSSDALLIAGHRGMESVVGIATVAEKRFDARWASSEIATGLSGTGAFYLTVAPVDGDGTAILIGEGFNRAPEIAVIEGGTYRAIRSFGTDKVNYDAIIASADVISWNAPDGLEISGWLLRPPGRGPHPTIMVVHGGPVWHSRPMWLGRYYFFQLLLLRRGYALFLPNPRGSAGWGTAFARHVVGDMAGADTNDLLSGLDHLVAAGIADPDRLGVTGGSYGGYMTAWLITQDDRFAAAVPWSPVTNRISARLLSNIPDFTDLFLQDDYHDPRGRFVSRSPVFFGDRVRTPTMLVCGALDRCTPPSEAAQFYNILAQRGLEAALVTYPKEGHGVRQAPATVDFAARVATWFETYMPAKIDRKLAKAPKR